MPTGAGLVSIRDQIADHLRGELLGGRYSPGDPLREEALARRFGVSRVPIRQVLQQLVHEGLLIARQNCGVAVAPPPADSVRELLLPMRVMIEAYALRIGFDEIKQQELGNWKYLLGRLRLACEAGNHAEVVERDFDLHRALLLQAGLSDLMPLWTLVLNKTSPCYGHHSVPKEDLLVVHAIHVALFEVFSSGDLEGAVEALTQHILDTEFNEDVRRRWHRDAIGISLRSGKSMEAETRGGRRDDDC